MQYYWVSIISMLFGVGFGAVLGLIPASIARKKGHSFALWWFYGWMLFLVSMIHVMFIADYSAGTEKEMKRKTAGQGRMCAAAAGMFFLVVAFYRCYWILWINYYASVIMPKDVIYAAVLFILSLFLFIGRKNTATLAVFALYGIFVIFSGKLSGPLELVGILLLLGMAAESILPSLRDKTAGIMRKLWFLPGILHFLGFILKYAFMGGYYFVWNWQVVLMHLVQAGGYLMIGLWFFAEQGERVPAPVPVNIYTDDYRESDSDFPAEDGTKEASLRSYRSLVNSGLMTEEEFEEKKRQLSER